jgi:hypothetical protein
LSAQEKREEALQQMGVDELDDLVPVTELVPSRLKSGQIVGIFDGNASIRRQIAQQNGGSIAATPMTIQTSQINSSEWASGSVIKCKLKNTEEKLNFLVAELVPVNRLVQVPRTKWSPVREQLQLLTDIQRPHWTENFRFENKIQRQ